MNAIGNVRGTTCLSHDARKRMLSVRGEPLFLCEWSRAVFIHYEVDAATLQREVPFPLDLYEGHAYISLVAFTMRDMRPRRGGRLTAALLKPIATHEFLNVRTYVKYNGEPGIYFLAEWLPNKLSLLLGPSLFGLPYRYGRLEYRHEHEQGSLRGGVSAQNGKLRLKYEAAVEPGVEFQSCEVGSRDEFLMERYTAFTAKRLGKRLFRVWHPAWPQMPIELSVTEDTLLTGTWGWFKNARLIGANYSPGFEHVWMGRPLRG